MALNNYIKNLNSLSFIVPELLRLKHIENLNLAPKTWREFENGYSEFLFIFREIRSVSQGSR